MGDSEVDYEYEYDPSDTETFYVDIDLTTASSHKRPALRKSTANNDEDGEVAGDDARPSGDESTPVASHSLRDSDPRSVSQDVQILALHSQNPMIAYQNQVYHCTWSDMIGTALYFSGKDGDFENPLHTTRSYHLINTSRIKLIGQKVQLTRKRGLKRKQPDQDENAEVEDEEPPTRPESHYKGLGDFRTSNPHINSELRKQATFLETMMDVKRSRGETDIVRTTWGMRSGNVRPTRPLAADEPPRTATRDQEIDDLNRRVVRGDGDALLRLQAIYSNLGEPEPELSSASDEAAESNGADGNT